MKNQRSITVSKMNGIVSPLFHDETRACIKDIGNQIMTRDYDNASDDSMNKSEHKTGKMCQIVTFLLIIFLYVRESTQTR